MEHLPLSPAGTPLADIRDITDLPRDGTSGWIILMKFFFQS